MQSHGLVPALVVLAGLVLACSAQDAAAGGETDAGVSPFDGGSDANEAGSDGGTLPDGSTDAATDGGSSGCPGLDPNTEPAERLYVAPDGNGRARSSLDLRMPGAIARGDTTRRANPAHAARAGVGRPGAVVA